jgi:type II secretory pathway pseudopilin PulG
MLVVLLLISFVAAISAPATGRFLNSLDFRKETQAIRATMNQARLLAVTSGKKVTVSLEENDVALRLSGPETVIKKFTKNSELTLHPEEIIFLPEGRATPATLTYRHKERTWEINIDPLTGLVVEP